MKKNLLKILLVVLFVSSFILMIFSAKLDSQTTDEAIHLFSGYTYLTKGDFRLDPEHPPLLKELAALTLLAQKVNIQLGTKWQKAGEFYYDSWQEARILSEKFFYTWGNNPDQLLFWGRLPFIMLTLLLGFLVFYWAKKLYGTKSGILAAILTLFFPNFLAHGRLINTDLGVTLFIFLTIFLWGNFLKKPTYLNLLLSGLGLGLVLSSKFTGILIVPILIILTLIKIFWFDPAAKHNWWLKYLGGLIGIKIIAFVMIWCTYGFSTTTPPVLLGSLSQNIYLGTGFNVPATFDAFFAKIRFLLFPADFYKGLILILRHSLGGHASFLLGANSNTGWWYYFPIAIFYKTPIPIFIFLILTMVYFKKIRAKNLFDEMLLIVPPLIYLIFSLFSKADLGVRHILPIFPFVFVFVSKSINAFEFKFKKSSLKTKLMPTIFIILVIWYLLSAIFSFPNYLAYFNEFAGGSKGGYKILTDSNLDWGQDIYRLKDYLDEHQIKKVYLVYPWDGDVAIKYYGIDFQPLYPEDTKVSGPVVASVTYLQMEAYSWLKQYPFEQITPGLFVFQLP